MARAKFIDNSDFELTISTLAKQSPEIVDKALKAGASIIADEMRKRLVHVLSPEATGDMLDSFGFTPVKHRADGSADTHIGFDGYDRKGVANQLKARVLESGAKYSNGKIRKAHPFARPAVKASRERAIKAMQETVDREIKKITNKGV